MRKSAGARSLFSRGSTVVGPQPACGQADRARRPRRRRDARIARPARVLMRWRKPCVLARLRLFGWKVCLLTSHSIDRRQTQLTCGSTEAGCRPNPALSRFARPPTPASREDREVRTHRGTSPQHRTPHPRGALSRRSNRGPSRRGSVTTLTPMCPDMGPIRPHMDVRCRASDSPVSSSRRPHDADTPTGGRNGRFLCPQPCAHAA